MEQTPAPQEQPLPTQTVPEIIQQKEQVALEKKKKFAKKTIITIITVLSITTLLVGGLAIWSYFKKKPPVQVSESGKQEISRDVDIKKASKFDSGTLKVSFEYPTEATAVEFGEYQGIKKIEVIYDKNTENTEGIDETNLSDGYIFRISTFGISNRNLDEIARIKHESFEAACPETATITKVTGILLDDIAGATFQVNNCGPDYILTYIPRFGWYYEFARIIKGDIGFEQHYRAITDEMMSTVDMYPEDTGPVLPYDTFVNDKNSITFNHPKLSYDCCTIPAPLEGKGWIATLANPETQSGISIYLKGFEKDQDFNAFLKKQKDTLIDDYIVVKGKQPKPEDIHITVGGINAVMLRNYSWKDLDIIYIDITAIKERGKAIIISVKNNGDFDEALKMILDTFKVSK